MRIKTIISILVLAIFFSSCSKNGSEPEEKTVAQLLNEGWQAFTNRAYPTAIDRFNEVIHKDASLVDAYNGAGWANAKLANLESALNRFNDGIGRNPDNLEIKAGLAFINNALKYYDASTTLAFQVIQFNENWVFSRDRTVGVSDLRLLMAENYFATAHYAESLAQVQFLNPTFNPPGTISTDVSAQAALAQEIERLRLIA